MSSDSIQLTELLFRNMYCETPSVVHAHRPRVCLRRDKNTRDRNNGNTFHSTTNHGFQLPCTAAGFLRCHLITRESHDQILH